MTTSAFALGPRFEQALVYAYQQHHTQVRKGPHPIPYLGHLLGVCSLVIEHGGTETEAIAALLHDTLEDVGETAATEIEQRFGPAVLEAVLGCTDASKEAKALQKGNRQDWLDRKTRYIEGVTHKSASAVLVALADKVYNARTIQEDFLQVGDALWDRFNAGKWGTLWYYRSLTEAFEQLDLPHPGAQRLRGLLKRTVQTTEQFAGVAELSTLQLRERMQ